MLKYSFYSLSLPNGTQQNKTINISPHADTAFGSKGKHDLAVDIHSRPILHLVHNRRRAFN